MFLDLRISKLNNPEFQICGTFVMGLEVPRTAMIMACDVVPCNLVLR